MGSLIDIHPENVSASETYRYKAFIGSNDSIEINGPPQGQVAVRIPYDGEKYFPIRSAEELQERQSMQELHIGSVAIGEPKDWKGDWKQQTGFQLLNVDIPLRTTEVIEEQWTADELWVQSSHEYTPEQPNYYPIQVLLQVLDRYAIHPMRLAGDGYKDESVWIELAKASNTLVRDNVLSFEFLVKANLPSILGGQSLAVHLEAFRFAWPGIPPRSQFRFYQWVVSKQDLVDLNWDYDPERQEILLADVEMVPIRLQQNGNPLTSYQALIHVDLLFASGKLLEEDRLIGEACVSVDNTLLSGRDVAWITARGNKSDSSTQVIKKTFVETKFEASLTEQFNEKRSFIFRHWVFPGVTRQTARYNDVVALLLDMGYSSVGPGPGEGKIVGKRQVLRPGQDLSDLYVWIELTEELSISTTRERKLEDAETYRTEISTKVLAVNFYAQMDGSGGILARDAENLMQRLKDQFAAVADLR